MNKEQALTHLKNYAEGKANEADYQAALAYFQSLADSNLNDNGGLERLFQELVNPGGISCPVAQDLMLQFVDPLAKKPLLEREQKAFLQHLVQCPICSESFLLLNDITSPLPEQQPLVIPKFKIPAIKKEIDIEESGES